MRVDTHPASTTSTSPGQSESRRPTFDQRQAAARAAYRESCTGGKPLTGAELGDLFGLSERWGRDRIAEVRAAGVNGNGKHVHGAPSGSSSSSPDRSGRLATVANRGPHAPGDALESTSTMPTGSGNGDHNQHGSTGDSGDATRSRRPRASLSRAGDPSGSEDPRPSGSTDQPTTGSTTVRSANLALRPLSFNGGSITADGPDPHGNGSGACDGSGPTANGATAHLPPGGSPGPWIRRTTVAAVVTVAVVASVVSFVHQLEVATLAGEGWRAWLIPFSVDGMMVAASMTLLTPRCRGSKGRGLAAIALALGLLASLAANVIAADPTMVDRIWLSRMIAAWPPLALAISFELCLRQLRSSGLTPATGRLS